MKHLKPCSRLEILSPFGTRFANAPLRFAQNDKRVFQKLGCSPFMSNAHPTICGLIFEKRSKS